MAERTKIWIADKMKELMKAKPLDKIRVTEICRVAEIERPTFYYHFKDKYDLVAWIFLSDAYETDVISAESAAQGMAKMRQEFTALSLPSPRARWLRWRRNQSYKELRNEDSTYLLFSGKR